MQMTRSKHSKQEVASHMSASQTSRASENSREHIAEVQYIIASVSFQFQPGSTDFMRSLRGRLPGLCNRQPRQPSLEKIANLGVEQRSPYRNHLSRKPATRLWHGSFASRHRGWLKHTAERFACFLSWAGVLSRVGPLASAAFLLQHSLHVAARWAIEFGCPGRTRLLHCYTKTLLATTRAIYQHPTTLVQSVAHH